MAPLTTFPLPLPPNAPPAGYGWEERDVSALSTTTAFNTGIDRRDIFLGQRRCVVCGEAGRTFLQHCHIIRDSEPYIWENLKQRGWIPERAKKEPRHEPRDGLLMCANHHLAFDAYDFFIRLDPDTRKFIFVNYSDSPSLRQFHGKAIAIDIRDRYAPFPSIFIIHEMRVRGFHPFNPPSPDITDGSRWQDWILSDGVFNNATGHFNRDHVGPPGNSDQGNRAQEQLQFPFLTTGSGDPPPSGRTLAPLNNDVIAEILAATRAMPSWKACQIEGTSWEGSAEENIQKYVSSIGVEEDT